MAQRIELGHFCKKVATMPSTYDGMIDYIDISSVDNKSKSITLVQSIDAKEAPSRAKQLVVNGDVLVSTVRPNLNAVAYVSLPTNNLLVASTGYCVLRCTDELNSRYVYHFCQSPYFVDDMTAQATGASYPAVSAAIVKSSLIPFSSLAEQQHIVSVLDKVSELIDLRKQQLNKLDEMVKARFVEMFGDCKNMVSMAELCSIITDGTHQPPHFQDEGIPFIFVSNLANNAVTYDAEKFISEETYAELYKRTPIEIGDLLLSTVGSYGHPAVIIEDRKFLFQRHIAYLKPKHDLINSFYLHSALLSPDGQRQIEEKVKGIAQKTLNLSEIRKILIPVPNIEEQDEFADFVRQIDKSKLTVQQSLDKLKTLKKSLMQEYFG